MQYFEGTDVPFTTSRGKVKMGTICNINGLRNTCIITTGRRNYSVELSNVLWDGVPTPQIVVYRNRPYLAAPVGIHTHKKGLTRDSLSVMRLETGGRSVYLSNIETGSTHEGVYNKFISLPATISISTLIDAALQSASVRTRWLQFGSQAAIQFYGGTCSMIYNQGQNMEIIDINSENIQPDFIHSLIVIAYGVDNAPEIQD